MNQREINKKLLQEVFTSENLVSSKFVKDALGISDNKDSNERKYFDKFYSQLKNVGIIQDNELNIKYTEIFSFTEIRKNFIIESLLPLIEEYIKQRYILMRHFRQIVNILSSLDEDDSLSDKLTSDIIIKFKEYSKRYKNINIEKENSLITDKAHKYKIETLNQRYDEYMEVFSYKEEIRQPIKILDILNSAIIDLLDRLICNYSYNIENNYNIKNNYDVELVANSYYKIVFKDICFKEVLFFILDENKEKVKSEEITNIIEKTNKSLLYIVNGEKTKQKYKQQIIDVLFKLNIFVGDRQKDKRKASFTVGPTTLANFEKDWKMNSITKIESILFLIGKLTDIENLENEKRDAVLKIFSFRSIN